MSFVSTWSTPLLILDSSSQRDVSIKIVVASGSDTQSHELEILQHLQASDLRSIQVAAESCTFWTHSITRGPNGRHLCVVLELLGTRVSWVADQSQNYRLKADLARRVSGRFVEAVAYLHSCGVVHGGECSSLRGVDVTI